MSRPIYVISHSHWDREWHQTFQQFRLRLVRLIDDLLALLSAGPAFPVFMLDGQTIVLDDYLELRPERAADLRRLIQDGRLLIGPWYVHPDEFLVSGEAIVRNLLLGARMCREWGGHMAVGYVPDQFGHIAQLPQIWRGFGIDTSVLWRGVDRAEARTAFHWQAPDGSTVLAVALPDGYNNAERLPAGGHALAERLRGMAASQQALAGRPVPALVMNGGDHAGVQADLPASLDAARAILGDEYTVIHGTLPDYVAALAAAGEPDAVLQGELRSPRSANLLPAVLSSRMWIKQRNVATQSLLERQAEPLATIAAALGQPYPEAELRQSWRYLLQNHPHDSICGCSIDQVHREMVTRFDWADQIAEALRIRALSALAASIDSIVPGAEDPRTLAVTVFNGAPVAMGGRIDVRLRLAGSADSYEVVDADGTPVPHFWLGERGESPTQVTLPREEIPDVETIMAQVEGDRVFGVGVMAVTMRTMGDALQIEVTVGDQALLSRAQIEDAVRDAFRLADEAGSIRAEATIHRSMELHLAALVPEVPACGYSTLLLRPRAKAPAASVTEPAAPALLHAIENDHYRVEADPHSGVLTVIERSSGMRIAPASLFVDDGEAGDLYTHYSPLVDTTISSDHATAAVEQFVDPLGQILRVRQVLRVPRELNDSRYERTADLVNLPIETTVRLAPGDALVRFSVTVDNAARDHRLRAHFRLPFSADHAHAEDAFCLIERAAQPEPLVDAAEAPVGTAPHQGVVAVHGPDRGSPISFLLATRGLPEYELLPRDDGSADLALTLLRCTGWLSRSDLATRAGEAGPSLPTPEAQCQGTARFEYAVSFGDRPWREMLPSARGFAVDLCTAIAPCVEGALPPRAALLDLSPAALVLSALKGAEDGRGAVIRIYNDGAAEQHAQLRLLLPVRRVALLNLAEQEQRALFDDGPRTEIAFSVPAAGIVSLRLEWAERSGTRSF